jgi:fructose/tagatose bisphosphate aldolase
MFIHDWQVPIAVHFDHGTSKQDLVEALELVSVFF